MAGTFNLANGSWATDANLNAASIAANAETDSAVIALNTKIGVQVSIDVTYGGTITGGGVQVYVLCDVDGTNYEARTTDSPYGFTLPTNASGHVRRTFFVDAEDCPNFKVGVYNPTGNSSVTVTLRTRDVTGATT